MTDRGSAAEGAARAPRLLADMAHTLESGERAEARVQRVLELLGQLVPSDRCALLQIEPQSEPRLFLAPEATARDRHALGETLEHFMTLLSGDDDARRAGSIRSVKAGVARSHLALPMVGVGRVFGVVFVERDADDAYDDQSVSLLTVVASLLATYLTTVGLLEKQARSSREIGQAHDFQQLLVGIVSHDLRNPLGVVLGSAGLLLPRLGDTRLVKITERIISNAQRATRIINDLLDLTRARLGTGIPISRRRVDLRGLLEQVIEESGAADTRRQILLSGPECVLGDWDPDRVAQVVTNLLSNALQYAPPGTPVRIALSLQGDHAVLEVHNTGAPIAADVLPHIFDPFKRGERVRRTEEGLGLGLYIVEQIVAGHGGRVEAQSTEATGTLFTVVLPGAERGTR